MPSIDQMKRLPLNWQSIAPANSMVLGEHSVVYGHPAIACALDQYIYIDWQSRPDDEIHIHSALAEHSTNIQSLLTKEQAIHPQLKFVCHALVAFADHLTFGLTIRIRSEFSSTIGLGSSAAVLAAMLSGLNQNHKTTEINS
jgi:mevalonate kinase